MDSCPNIRRKNNLNPAKMQLMRNGLARSVRNFPFADRDDREKLKKQRIGIILKS